MTSARNSPAPPFLFSIIYENDRMLVINKPAGLVCHPTKAGAFSSLIGRLRLYLGHGHRNHDGVHLISRLDRETSGLTVVAKTPTDAKSLREVWESGIVRKNYLAICYGHPDLDEGEIEAPLGKDRRSPIAIKDCIRPDGTPAKTQFHVLDRFERQDERFSLVQASPITGRKHQIRIHLAHLGHPVVGDKIYGPHPDTYLAFVNHRLTDEQRERLLLPHHALHATSLTFEWHGQTHHFESLPEAPFRAFANLSKDFQVPAVP